MVVPTTREVIAAALTEPEQQRFLPELERSFARGKWVRKIAGAYLVVSGPRASGRLQLACYAARSR